MKVNLEKVKELAEKFNAEPNDMPKLTGIFKREWEIITHYGYADPEVVGKLAAFLGCDPQNITIRPQKKRYPHPRAVDLNSYRIECIMAKEDISYEELRQKCGFDPSGYIKVGYCRPDKAEALANALYTTVSGIEFKSMYKKEADPAGTESTSEKDIAETV